MSRYKVVERVRYAYPPDNPYWTGEGVVKAVARTYAIVLADGRDQCNVFLNNELRKIKKKSKGEH